MTHSAPSKRATFLTLAIGVALIVVASPASADPNPHLCPGLNDQISAGSSSSHAGITANWAPNMVTAFGPCLDVNIANLGREEGFRTSYRDSQMNWFHADAGWVGIDRGESKVTMSDALGGTTIRNGVQAGSHEFRVRT